IRSDVAAQKGLTPQSTLKDKAVALKGLTVATTGNAAGTDDLLRVLLQEYGVSYDKDLKVVYMSQTAELAAILQGTVQAAVLGAPFYSQAINTGTAQMLVNVTAGEFALTKGHLQGTYFSSPDVVTSKQPALAAFLQGINKGLTFARDQKNLEESTAIVHEY